MHASGGFFFCMKCGSIWISIAWQAYFYHVLGNSGDLCGYMDRLPLSVCGSREAFLLHGLYFLLSLCAYSWKMEKDFDRWNKRKKNIDAHEALRRFHEGEIWWCSAGLNIGHEIDGKHKTFERPFYILKKCSKNMFIGIPCTTNTRLGFFSYTLEILKWNFILNFSQVKSVSSKRLLRRMVKVSSEIELDVANKFVHYVINRKPAD